MQIYVDRQTHMPFYLPIQCPVGFCEPGVSAGEDCCNCYRRPPPPCGPCFGEQDTIFEDNFETLEPEWWPDWDCEPDSIPGVCRWGADGLLWLDSFDGPGALYHNLTYVIPEAPRYWTAHVRQVSLNGSFAYEFAIARSFFGLGDVEVRYETGGSQGGDNEDFLELWIKSVRRWVRTSTVHQLPLEYSLSCTDDGLYGVVCLAVDGEVVARITRGAFEGIPPPATAFLLGAEGGYRDENGHNLRMAEWDYACLRDMEFAETLSAKTKQWLASVNA